MKTNDKPPLRVLGLAGSPRVDGNSEQLLDAFLAGMAEGGAQVEKTRLAEREIAPCAACETCHRSGVCCIHDDANAIQEQLWRADVTALAVPIYFYAAPAQAKALIDRCQALYARKEILGRRRPAGRGVLLSAAASRGARLFDGELLTARYWMDTFFTKLAAVRLLRGIEGPGDIARRAGALEDAAALGRRMARNRRYREEIGG
jgi:multimeric flavodoxin WrbA